MEPEILPNKLSWEAEAAGPQTTLSGAKSRKVFFSVVQDI